MLPAFVSEAPDHRSRRKAGFLPLAAILVAILTAAILHAPSLQSGLVADDHLQVAMLDGSYPVERGVWDLYAFSQGGQDVAPLMKHGVLPWWSHSDLRLSALRPLSSLTLWLDVNVLKLSPWSRHLHSLLWLAAFLIAAHVFFCRVLERRAAALATLMLAVDPAHVWPTAWLANRTALISATLGLCALSIHLRHREQRSTTSAIAVPALVALSLAAGEYALSVTGLVVGFELMARGTHLRQRARNLLPWLMPALAYFSLHKLLGYGAVGSSVYVDPVSSPLKYILAIMLRLPALLASELFLLPSEIVHGALVLNFGPSLLIVVILCAAFLLLAALALRGQPEARRVATTFALGLLGSLLPLVATLPSSRLLVVPSVAGAGLLATVIASLAFSPRKTPWLRIPAVLFGAAVFTLHVPFALAHSRTAASEWSVLHTRIAGMVQSAKLRDNASSWVLLNAAQPTAIYLPWMRKQSEQPTFAVLTISPEPVTVRRPEQQTLELIAGENGMLTDPASRLFRGIETPFPNLPVTTGDVRVSVTEKTIFGVKRVRVDFLRPLDDPGLLLLVLESGRLRPFSVPPVGAEVRIPGLH